jgi:hypothetical protein
MNGAAQRERGIVGLTRHTACRFHLHQSMHLECARKYGVLPAQGSDARTSCVVQRTRGAV